MGGVEFELDSSKLISSIANQTKLSELNCLCYIFINH